MEEKDIVIEGQQEALLFHDACMIIDEAQKAAYRQVNETLIKRNWLLGLRIQHEVLKDKRAEYGEQVVKVLAKELTAKYGEGFTWRNLYNYADFYSTYNGFFLKDNGDSVNYQTILHALSAKSENIFHALRAKSPILLSWTHYRIILQENSKEARDWYEQEAAREMWGTRTLQRNVSSQYYHRLLKSQNKALVHDEMVKRIHTEKEDYYIDMVFYNYNLHSFVLIDLKTTKPKREDLRREIEQQKEFYRLQHKEDK